ncbi:MAG TPA: translation initiation factor IF-2 [Firmicutes bacterium]|nr:translation initiation factor IF-2 [Bacillota bacterium]
MAANQKNQTRISNLAKDLGLKNKDILDILAENGIEGKSHSGTLDPDEFNLVVNELTSRNQITGIGEYLDGKTKIPPRDKGEAKSQPKSDAKPDAKPEPKPDAKPESKPDAKSESKPDAKPEPKPDAKPEPKPDAKSESKPEIKPEAKPEAAPEAKADIKSESKPEVKTEVKADIKSETRPEVKTESKPEPKLETEGARPQKNESAERRDSVHPQNRDGARSQNRDGGRDNANRDGGRDSARPQNRDGGRDSSRPQSRDGNRPQNRDGSRPQSDGRAPQQGRDGGRQDGSRQQGSRPDQSRQNGDFRRDGNRPNQSGPRVQGRDNGFRDKDKEAPQQRNSPKPAPVHTYTRGKNVTKPTGESRVVDTRTTTVDLDKYDERIENIVPDANKDTRGEKQKLKKQNTRDYQSQREKERVAMEKMRKQGVEKAKKQPLQITVPDEITVGELASRLKITAGEVIKKLMGLGVMATVNQTIDYDTAYLVADELGAKVTREVVVTIEERLFDESEDKAEDLVPRSPVVCVMGHVDHGKTSLLDAIRHTNVTAGEAGGITQAIGAYRVKVNDREITFLDTPGHEAFTAMRARGAKSTDIAILVVAADDGIMPQTVEAINHAKAAGIDIVVAINKMDKPGANPDNVKQELTKYNLVPEEWGGDVICVPVSAVTGEGIDDLLENLLLVADMKELKANPNRRAKGLVIEAKLDRGRGPVATVLVQNGTLHSGDIVIAGTAVGRVRAMTDDKGRNVKSAGPSVPVEIIGLSEVPESGDEFAAVEDERMARELAEQRREKTKEEQFKANAKVNLNDLFAQISEGVKDLNIIVKADVGGSAEAVKQSLEKLSNEEVRVNIIHTAVGGITEGDVMLAAASNALIIGFNVRPDKNALDSAEKQNVEIRTYRIIYECIEEIEAAMKGMLAPKTHEVLQGHAEVRQTIHVPNVGTIAGSYIQDGKVTRNSQIRVVRDGVVIFEDRISSLKRFKDDAREVVAGYECGIGLERFNDIKEGDILEAYVIEEIKN